MRRYARTFFFRAYESHAIVGRAGRIASTRLPSSPLPLPGAPSLVVSRLLSRPLASSHTSSSPTHPALSRTTSSPLDVLCPRPIGPGGGFPPHRPVARRPVARRSAMGTLSFARGDAVAGMWDGLRCPWLLCRVLMRQVLVRTPRILSVSLLSVRRLLFVHHGFTRCSL